MGSDQKHVLLVEDSEDDQEVYRHFLSMKGFRVSTASNGRECLEIASQALPDIILLDLWMPEMGGWEASQHLKNNPRTTHIPVVVITGHSYIQADKWAYDGFIIKPCMPNDLEAEILRVLEAHRHPASQTNTNEAA